MKTTLTGRMVLGFGLVILISLASAVYSVYSLHVIQEVSVLAATAGENDAEMNYNKYLLWDVRMATLRVLLDRDEASLEKLAEARKVYEDGMAELDPSILPELREKFDIYKDEVSDYMSSADELLLAAQAGDWEEAMRIRNESLSVEGAHADEAAREADTTVEALVEHTREQRREIIGSATVTAIVSGALVLVSSMLIALVLVVSIRKPLSILVTAAHTMSEGDYSFEIAENATKDEIGNMTRAFIEMKQKTRELISQVGGAANSVAAASRELSTGAEETGRAIQQVSDTVQEVAKGSQETTRSLSQAQENLSENAKAIQIVSHDIDEVAHYASLAASQGGDGKQSADQAVQIINRAAESVQDTAQVVRGLGQKTQQISEFISIITGIADQTNLLALNAAIEAARAGDAGRGFAVVAEEVRKLAEESNEAAGNITRLVRDIAEQMETALSAMERSNQEVSEGAETVSGASRVLAEIVTGVDALSEKVQSISAASQQINASSTEIVDAMNVVATIAEENSSASEEVSAATEQQSASMQEIASSAINMSKLSADLQELVHHFKV
ncbi:HAMP domain-containing protein [bacterium]|nr:HAMP domain-containing protein [bacterium]